MSDFTIYVCYDPAAIPPFKYTDENGNDAKTKTGCHKRKTIKWVPKGGCQGSNLKIHFPNGDPFAPPRPDPLAGTEYKFNDKHKTSYKYDVSVTYNGDVKSDDPQIMFDDGTRDDDIQLFDDSLTKLGTAAQSAFQGLLTNLKASAALKRDPNAEFFPGGINNIQVQVTVPVGLANITVSITVSGSEPTALFNGKPAKK